MTDDTRIIDLTVADLRTIINDMVDQRMAQVQEERKEEYEAVKGGKEIAKVLGLGKSRLYEIRQDLIKNGAVYYNGRAIVGVRSRLLEYRDQYMIR